MPLNKSLILIVEFVIVVVKIIYINTLIQMKIEMTESGGGSGNKKRKLLIKVWVARILIKTIINLVLLLLVEMI